MFWRFGFHSGSAIDSILDKDGPKLEDIMAEEELVQQVKGQNVKLIELYPPLTQPISPAEHQADARLYLVQRAGRKHCVQVLELTQIPVPGRRDIRLRKCHAVRSCNQPTHSARRVLDAARQSRAAQSAAVVLLFKSQHRSVVDQDRTSTLTL